MTFKNQEERQIELNDVFKGNAVSIVDREGRVYLGREYTGCYAAVVMFRSPLNETITKQSKEIVYDQNLCKSDVIADDVLRLYDANNNISVNELSDRLAVHRGTIKRCVSKINKKTPGRISLDGGTPYKAVAITPHIQALMNSGVKFSVSALARELKVDRATVMRAIRDIKNNAVDAE
jgi:predicted transcriptional regulator